LGSSKPAINFPRGSPFTIGTWVVPSNAPSDAGSPSMCAGISGRRTQETVRRLHFLLPSMINWTSDYHVERIPTRLFSRRLNRHISARCLLRSALGIIPCVYLWGTLLDAVLCGVVEDPFTRASYTYEESPTFYPLCRPGGWWTRALCLLTCKTRACLGLVAKCYMAHLRPSPCGKCRL